MTATFKELEEQAQSLAAEDRERLTEVETAWTQEIEERVAAFDRGETKTYAAEDVFAEARRLDQGQFLIHDR